MTDRPLFERLYAHALHWQSIGEHHPGFRDPALIRDLKEAAKLLAPSDTNGESMARLPTLSDFGIDKKAALIETSKMLAADLIKAETEIERLRAVEAALRQFLTQLLPLTEGSNAKD